MKSKSLNRLIIACLFCLPFGLKGSAQIKEAPMRIYYDSSEPAIIFSANDLQNILVKRAIEVTLKPLSELPGTPEGNLIVIAKDDETILSALNNYGGAVVKTLGEQDYVLRVTEHENAKSYWAIGGDRVGAMYGGIHIGEIVKAFGLDSIKNEDHKPYIAKRGLKFNIPLDERQPSHDDSGTAAQSNIENMWDFNFWTEYLDVLARQRYNVLSLWNKHPFPSMVQLDDYPDVALEDVYNKAGKVKDMTIEEKIAMWQKVMDYAYDRGIEIYIITWNIHMNGALDKYGITEDNTNETTKDYLRKSVEKIFLTYPKLACIGVTAGENMNGPESEMNGMSSDDKEQWLWETYGKGVQDVHEKQPERNIRFIHRYWWTDFDKIDSRFGQLKDGYDLSFKYARARIYAAYNPPFAEKELLPQLPEKMATWWNIRNDDIYNLRWGDPEYVKQFILNFPKGGKTAGYYLGSDRYAWGRESISKNPLSPRMLENEKHWYSFLLWGRLGYDPETSTDLLKGLLKNRFPTTPGDTLYKAWQAASKIVPLVNKFHWFAWDYLWWPEAGISTGYGVAIAGYHDINDFIDAPVMPFSDLITIKDYAETVFTNKKTEGTTPFQVADSLELFSKTALQFMKEISGNDDMELTETIGDIKAMAYLGNYYAAKIRGAVYLKFSRESKDEKYKNLAISELERALLNWQKYSKVLDTQYIKMTIAMHGLFDWDKLEEEIKADIEIARKPLF
ncbi:MAG: hypothetical protein ACERKD_12700 [Prolixibacteraceae bacterium]